jgi:hypothetical protein
MKALRSLLAVILVGGLLMLGAGHAHAATTVRPGDQLYTPNGDGTSSQCTANFGFTNGTQQFIGLAAHCFGLGGNTDTNGCLTTSKPLGAEVDDVNDQRIGTLAYSSWLTMIQKGEDPNSETCQYNDLALVLLDPGVTLNPTVPSWGGPNGMTAAGAPEAGKTVYTYGNSSLRQGITLLSPKKGTGIDDSPGGWSHLVQTTNPGVPGDSGSGFMDVSGNAFGVLSTLDVAIPGGVANGVGDLGRELAYANANGGVGTVSVLKGTTAFNPNGSLTAALGI